MRILVNNLYRPEIEESSVTIDQTASDPVPTCSFVVHDDTSSLTINEMSEVVIIDNDAYPQPPAHNLAVNPLWNPYTTSWTSSPAANLTLSQNGGGGFIVTAANAANAAIGSMFQTTARMQSGGGPQIAAPLIAVGQKYMLSVYAQGASAVNLQVFLEMLFRDTASGILLTVNQTFTVSSSIQQFSIQGTAPAGTTGIRMRAGAFTTSSTNSGTITLTSMQMEPMFFTSLSQAYPTPACNASQANCVVLPNGTTVRQKRLFTGWALNMIYSNYRGVFRDIAVTASGPAWILDTRLQAKTYTNQTDAFIINDTVGAFFNSMFTYNHVQAGLTYSNIIYNRDTLRSIVDNLASSAGFRYVIDPYYDFWFLPAGYYTASYTLADSASNPASNQYVYANYSREVDFTQPGNEITVLESGGPSAMLVGDGSSRQNYGYIFDRKVDDNTVSNDTDAYNRAIAEIITYSTPRVILKLEIDERAAQTDLMPGNAITITSAIEGFTEVTYLIQKVHITVLGTDKTQKMRYLYQLELGNFNSDLVSLLVRHRRLASQSATASITFGTQHMVALESFSFSESETHTP